MNFHFQATRANGERVSSRISAYDFAEAQSTLKSRGFRDIELTRIDSLSEQERGSSSGGFQPPRAIFALMFVVVVVGGIAVLVDMNSKAGDGDTREELAAAQLDRNSSGSTATEPYVDPYQEEFDQKKVDAALLKLVLGNYVNETQTRATTRRDNRGRDHIRWLNLVSVSVREGTEIGYEYDVRVTYENCRGVLVNGEADTSNPFDWGSSQCVLLLHLSDDYLVSNPQWIGRAGNVEDARYIINVIREHIRDELSQYD